MWPGLNHGKREDKCPQRFVSVSQPLSTTQKQENHFHLRIEFVPGVKKQHHSLRKAGATTEQSLRSEETQMNFGTFSCLTRAQVAETIRELSELPEMAQVSLALDAKGNWSKYEQNLQSQ